MDCATGQCSKMIPIRDDAPHFTRPYVNNFLLGVNVVVFLLEVFMAPRQQLQLVYTFGMIPGQLTGAAATASPAFEPITIFTSMFLHAGWLHLLFNMWGLWIFGDNIEDYLGHFRYFVLYLLSGVGAAALHIFTNPTSTVPTIGASGAIAGVTGAYILLYPTARVTTWFPPIFFLQLPAWLVLGYWFVGQFLQGAASIMVRADESGGVAFWAHVGGFVTGIILIKLFPAKPRRYKFQGW